MKLTFKLSSERHPIIPYVSFDFKFMGPLKSYESEGAQTGVAENHQEEKRVGEPLAWQFTNLPTNITSDIKLGYHWI